MGSEMSEGARALEPEYEVTCNSDTYPNAFNITSGCDLLKHYDSDNDGVISESEANQAIDDFYDGKIFWEEEQFVLDCYQNYNGIINNKCPGCFATPTPTPGTVKFDEDPYITYKGCLLYTSPSPRD